MWFRPIGRDHDATRSVHEGKGERGAGEIDEERAFHGSGDN